MYSPLTAGILFSHVFLKGVLIYEYPNIDLSSLPNGQLSECTIASIRLVCICFLPLPTDVDSHLPLLMVALNPLVKWFDLGLHLGLSHATLKKIEIEQIIRVEECKREMLVAWLQSATNTTKQKLMSALLRLHFEPRSIVSVCGYIIIHITVFL